MAKTLNTDDANFFPPIEVIVGGKRYVVNESPETLRRVGSVADAADGSDDRSMDIPFQQISLLLDLPIDDARNLGIRKARAVLEFIMGEIRNTGTADEKKTDVSDASKSG